MATNDLSIWQQDITILRGVGPKLAEKLAKRGIRQVIDLLFYLPYRYQDRTRITPIGLVRLNEYAVLEGTTSQVQMRFGNKPSMTCKLSDASGSITLRFFHFHKAMKETLSLGARLRCFGEVRFYQNNFHMVHPEYTVIEDDKPVAVEETLTPIYHATNGLNQKTIRQLINQVLSLL